MVIYRPADEAQGFFGYLQGNSSCTVKNLIIDKSCSVIAFTKAAGLAGSCQNTGATITIENCVNEADVTVSGQDAAGIIGGQNDTNPRFIIRGCVNTGNITSTHASPYAGGLCCYLGNNENTIENFINLGSVTDHLGGNIGRMMGSVKGIIDLSDTEDKTQGIVEGLTSDDIASGVLTYYANKEAGKEVFFQTLGEDNYPVPFSTSQSVKQISVSETGHATYVAEDNVQFPSPLQAYTIVSVSNDYAHLSEAITEAPIGEPVLVKGAEGKYCYNPVASAASPAINMLQAATADILCDGTQFSLADGEDGIGFYRATIGSTLAAGEAYLPLSGDEVKPFYGLEFNDATAIKSVDAGRGTANVYNIRGQQISNSRLPQGVIILNNKKVVNK